MTLRDHPTHTRRIKLSHTILITTTPAHFHHHLHLANPSNPPRFKARCIPAESPAGLSAPLKSSLASSCSPWPPPSSQINLQADPPLKSTIPSLSVSFPFYRGFTLWEHRVILPRDWVRRLLSSFWIR